MLKQTAKLNIPRQITTYSGMEDKMKFDGAPGLRYQTMLHGFTLEVKIPKPKPVLIETGPQCKEFPDVVADRPLPRAYRLINPIPNLDEHLCGFNYEHVPKTILASRSNDVAIRMYAIPAKVTTPINQYVDGDHVWYVHEGMGTVATNLGYIPYCAGQYIYIPKGFLSSFRVEQKTIMTGMYSSRPFLRPSMEPYILRAPYNEFDLRLPRPLNYILELFGREGNKWRVDHVREGMRYTSYYDSSPLTCYAYQGTPYPFVLSIDDVVVPITPQVHTDPTAFTTFTSLDHAVSVSTFKKRWVHSPPYDHHNTYDEFLFLAKPYGPREGSGIGRGDAVFHPQGFMHGPHKEVEAKNSGATAPEDQSLVDDLAIMFESTIPLHPTLWAGEVDGFEIKDYWKSWFKK